MDTDSGRVHLEIYKRVYSPHQVVGEGETGIATAFIVAPVRRVPHQVVPVWPCVGSLSCVDCGPV